MAKSDTQFKKGNQAAKGHGRPSVAASFRQHIMQTANNNGDFEFYYQKIREMLRESNNFNEIFDFIKYLAPITKKELEGNDEIMFTERDKIIIEEVNKLSIVGLKAMSDVMKNPQNLKEDLAHEDAKKSC